jgi:hypothetical protein
MRAVRARGLAVAAWTARSHPRSVTESSRHDTAHSNANTPSFNLAENLPPTSRRLDPCGTLLVYLSLDDFPGRWPSNRRTQCPGAMLNCVVQRNPTSFSGWWCSSLLPLAWSSCQLGIARDVLLLRCAAIWLRTCSLHDGCRFR